MKGKNSLALLLFLSIPNNFGCPFIITNDSNSAALIVDPYNKQAIQINPGDQGEIDPSISGWQYYFYHEKLDIYVPRKNNPNLFYRQYQLTEKYCTEGKTELTMNEIAHFLNKPTDRFDTVEFRAHEDSSHTH